MLQNDPKCLISSYFWNSTRKIRKWIKCFSLWEKCSNPETSHKLFYIESKHPIPRGRIWKYGEETEKYLFESFSTSRIVIFASLQVNPSWLYPRRKLLHSCMLKGFYNNNTVVLAKWEGVSGQSTSDVESAHSLHTPTLSCSSQLIGYLAFFFLRGKLSTHPAVTLSSVWLILLLQSGKVNASKLLLS